MSALKIHSMPEGLRRPMMILAFSGWNDAAESATTAARFLSTSFRGEKFAEIDPEEFYHFGLQRPLVRFKADSETEREVIWPSTDFFVARSPDLSRDLIVGVAPEPHLKWRTYTNLILELAERCGAGLVLTLGALLAEVAHTRPIRLSGGASDPELTARLGTKPTRYEGPTGIVGVLNTFCRERQLPVGSLWANVPHYISGLENPKASLALVERVLNLLDASADLGELEEAGRQFEQNLKEIAAQNPKIASYVRKLEAAEKKEKAEAKAQAPQSEAASDLPPAAQLVEELEEFLRRRPPTE